MSDNIQTQRVESSLEMELVRGPLVSVIVTNYNYQQYVGECLRSIAAQTYQKFECIIVDDKSTDNSVATIREFIATTNGAEDFKLVEPKANGGQMSAFIEGFRLSKGAFVVFVDADDYLFPAFLETHLKAHLNSRVTAGLSCSDEIIVDGDNQLLAGSYSKFFDGGSPSRQSKLHPISTTLDHSWIDELMLVGDTGIKRSNKSLVHISSSDIFGHKWVWTTTSAMMFRRGVLDLALTDRVRDIRICADFYLAQFCHRIGGSLLIDSVQGGYRVHGANNFAAGAVISSEAHSGTLTGNVSYTQIRERILDEVLLQYSMFVNLIGGDQTLRLIAAFGSFKAAGRIWKTIGFGNVDALARFIVFFVAIIIKKSITWVRRVFDFL